MSNEQAVQAQQWEEIDLSFETLVGQVLGYYPKADIKMIRKAYVYAKKKHANQVRKSGEPYIIHPLGVAKLVARLKLDESSICAALLHDVVEDTPTSLSDLEERFNVEVALLVDGLTKLEKYQFNSTIERQAANFRKMLLAMSKDLRVILIKLADRVHNMQTLQHMRADKQHRIAQETLDIFVPLANRLGIDWIKTELENLSLKYLHPEEYAELELKVEQLKLQRKAYISDVIQIIDKALRKEGIDDFELKGRFKHIFSIYRKLKRSNVAFEKLHDIIAFRIIVATKADCYHALGIIHSMWSMVDGRFKDYISLPKPNKYSSLHTSVFGPQQVRFEVQIRTYEMDRVAEEGIAAHWKYKEGHIAPQAEQRNYEWLRQLMEWQQELEDPNEFLNTIKVDLFSNEVYVFTPNGEIKNLPLGSTPIDFAYAVHTEVGNTCAGAIVNGQIVPLRYQLKTGDKVDIITKQGQRPKSDWLQMVSSNRARNRINRYLNQEEKQTHQQVGLQMLEKGLRRAQLSVNTIARLEDAGKFYSSLKLTSHEQLLIALGSEKLKIEQVIEKLKTFLPQTQSSDSPQPSPSQNLSKVERIVNRHQKRSQSNVCVDGIDNIALHFAKCCSPVPGEPIIGFITRGRGLAIHHMSCQRIKHVEPHRHVECHWDPKVATSEVTRGVNLRVIASDRLGMLVDVMKVMSEMKINVTQSHCRTSSEEQAIFAFEVQIRDLKQLQQLLRVIQKLPGVITAERVKG